MQRYPAQYLIKGKRHGGERSVGEWFYIPWRERAPLTGYVAKRMDTTLIPHISGAWRGTGAVYMIYIIKERVGGPDVENVRIPDDLLCHPILTGASGWSMGYFQPYYMKELAPAQVRLQHCYAYDNMQGHPQAPYVDDNGNVANDPQGIVVSVGVGGYGYVERTIAKELNLPLQENQ